MWNISECLHRARPDDFHDSAMFPSCRRPAMPIEVATTYIDEAPHEADDEEPTHRRMARSQSSRRGSLAGGPRSAPRSRANSEPQVPSAAPDKPEAAEGGVADEAAHDAGLSSLSKQFLSDIAATHHQAAFLDNRERQASYTAKLKAALAAEEEMERAVNAGGAAVQRLEEERAARDAPAPRPESPTRSAARNAFAAKIAVGARLRSLGVPCKDPDPDIVGCGSM